MMRVKNHHTPPTIRPDNDLGEQKKKGGRWKKEEEYCGDILVRIRRKKGRIWQEVEPGK